MKILTNKQQKRLLRYIVARAEPVKLSSFEGTHEEQIMKFGKFTSEVVDLCCIVGGLKGLAYAEFQLGISSNTEFTKFETDFSQ